MPFPDSLEYTASIKAAPSKVWAFLTDPPLLKQWLGEPEMQLVVTTDWKPGSPIVIRGFHHIKFDNRGTVIRSEPGKLLHYNYLSSISRLPARPENFTNIIFRLTASGDETRLTVNVSNFPTPTIRKHVEFYWSGTIQILKETIEKAPIP